MSKRIKPSLTKKEQREKEKKDKTEVIYDLYVNKKKSAEEIARMLHIGKASIQKYIHLHNPQRLPHKQYIVQQMHRAIAIIRDGNTDVSKICTELDIRKATLYKYLKDAGISLSNISKESRDEKAKQAYAMYKDGKKTKTIASELGVTQGAVINYIKLQDSQAFAGRIKSFTIGEMQKMYNAYKQGTSIEQLKKKYGISNKKIKAYISKRDPSIVFNEQHRISTAKKNENKRQAARILKEADILSISAICEVLDINRGTFNKYIIK